MTSNKWLWGAAVLGGVYLITAQKGPVAGLGLWNPKAKEIQDFIKKWGKDSWINHHSSGFTFSPTLSTAYWTVDRLALITPSSTSSGRGVFGATTNRQAVENAQQNPIILKATNVADLKKAVTSLQSNRDRALPYSKLKPPVPPNQFVWGGKQQPWDVDAQASKYVTILNSALSKAVDALSRAEKEEAEAKKRKEALDKLKEITKDTGPTLPSGPSLPEVAVENNDAEKESAYKEWVRGFTTPAPQPQPQVVTIVQQGGGSGTVALQRPQHSATVQPAAGESVNPVAAGIAAAVVPILAAVL